jgi:hypothetical protein
VLCGLALRLLFFYWSVVVAQQDAADDDNNKLRNAGKRKASLVVVGVSDYASFQKSDFAKMDKKFMKF